MTTFHFGTDYDPAAFVENTESGTNPPMRPTADEITAGWVLQARELGSGALPDIPIEAGTGYWNTSTTDIPIIEVSADQGSSWVPRYAHEAIVASITSALDGSAALGLITGIQTVVNDLNASLGQPGGIATLDENGILVQVAGLIPVGENDDGTYNARAAVPWPQIWVMRVPGTSLPDNDGSILGGGGIVEGLDYAVDLTISLGG